mmetsp:Transcript_92375/g.197970  ORF Transcript_92375/g.197970 Transcript_92375/m.197970 type:complete len:689 (-) Transcript_92375:44-2110(-)
MGQGGSRLEERYFLQKVKLGQGSFATVWRAVDRSSGDTVAVKQLDKARLRKKGVGREHVEREIAMLQACVHRNVTRLFDTFEDACSIYLALEYCDGGDFGDKVREVGLGLAESEAAEWVRQICAALAMLHSKRICHRDVKPDNFMVRPGATGSGGPGGELKLSDFGLAIFLPQGRLLTEKCGTPAYMSPELHLTPGKSRGYGLPADAWAAGISMYQVMFGGRHPFLDEHGHLDQRALVSGTLDFRDSRQGGQSCLRFSEAARRLCGRLVERNPGRRTSAQDALRSSWLSPEQQPARGEHGMCSASALRCGPSTRQESLGWAGAAPARTAPAWTSSSLASEAPSDGLPPPPPPPSSTKPAATATTAPPTASAPMAAPVPTERGTTSSDIFRRTSCAPAGALGSSVVAAAATTAVPESPLSASAATGRPPGQHIAFGGGAAPPPLRCFSEDFQWPPSPPPVTPAEAAASAIAAVASLSPRSVATARSPVVGAVGTAPVVRSPVGARSPGDSAFSPGAVRPPTPSGLTSGGGSPYGVEAELRPRMTRSPGAACRRPGSFSEEFGMRQSPLAAAALTSAGSTRQLPSPIAASMPVAFSADSVDTPRTQRHDTGRGCEPSPRSRPGVWNPGTIPGVSEEVVVLQPKPRQSSQHGAMNSRGAGRERAYTDPAAFSFSPAIQSSSTSSMRVGFVG